MEAPRKLSINSMSPAYNKVALGRVDKVFVDGVHLPSVEAYDMDAGWANQMLNGLRKAKVYGVVTVTMFPEVPNGNQS